MKKNHVHRVNKSNMKAVITVCAILFWAFGFGQNHEISISFNATFQGEELTAQADSIGQATSIEVLKFYVSNLILLADGATVFTEQNSFHLIDFSDARSNTFEFQLPSDLEYDQFSFNLGIDSTTNVSGVMGGDLDPTKGMYWTWQSGYINFKIEGKSPNCPTRKNKFQFHLGGYTYPYATIQEVALNTNDGKDINIAIDLDQFFAKIDLAEAYQVMQPSLLAVELSNMLPLLFTIAR